MYVDILFLINFALNYVSLYLAGRLTHDPTSPPRIAIASAIGAAAGVFAILFDMAGIPLFIFEIACAMLMALITYGISSVRRLFIDSVAVFGIASLLGGIMTVGDSAVYSDGRVSRTPTYVFILAGVASAVIYVITSVIGKRSEAKTAVITASIGNRQAKFTALVDTGNLVTEPISAMPAILASAEVVYEMTGGVLPSPDTANADLRTKIRAVPIHSSFGSGIEYGVIPDEVTVSDGKRTRKVSAVIVPEKRSAEAYGGFSATCPASLL